jgi:hypothetical protein
LSKSNEHLAIHHGGSATEKNGFDLQLRRSSMFVEKRIPPHQYRPRGAEYENVIISRRKRMLQEGTRRKARFFLSGML